MGQPYIGEIRIFAGNFAPAGWMFCEGQLLPISENDALFTLIGTTYGGDGQETFGLPDLRGRVPIHTGQGPGISTNRILGEQGGVESVTLTTNQIPAHTHPLMASEAGATANTPQGNLTGEATKRFYRTPGVLVNLAPGALSPSGGSQPHENTQPFLCVNFIISLFGIFPTQT
jgi:microcystin-dependent protein